MSDLVILFGGNSSEYKVACASAQHFSEILKEARCWYWRKDGSVCEVSREELQAHRDVFKVEYEPKNKLNSWPTVAAALDEAKKQNHILYLSLHGSDGENGWLQGHCESRKLAFTGSSSIASAIAMDKRQAKEKVRPRGVKLAEQVTFVVSGRNARENLISFQKQFGSIVLKPACEGSSMGLSFVSSASQVDEWWKANEASTTDWLCEEMLIGRELTIGVVMHGGCLTVLPPSEVILERNARFDYEGKYLGLGNREITPAELTPLQRLAAQEVSLLAHTAIGCYGYTRSEVIMTDRGTYYLETNTLPGFTKASFIPQQLRVAGIDIESFLRGQVELARARYD